MSMRKSNVRVFVLFIFYVIYLIIGASIFSAIEGPAERLKVKALRKLRAKFLQDNKECLTDAELEDFIVEIVNANNRGVSAAANVTMEPNWSFGQALFFAGTILTTIGYGHVTPLSEGGKVFCMVYAALGIPLTLVMFTALVERLLLLTHRLLRALSDRLGHAYRTLHIRLIHVSILFTILIVFIFLVPAAIFTAIEDDWNFLDAFYYCFISMTTIGLGDYIPGDNPAQSYRPLYKIATTFYLFLGLITMMLVLANVYDVPELNIGYHFYMKSDEVDGAGEATPIRGGSAAGGPPKYTQQVNEAYNNETDKASDAP